MIVVSWEEFTQIQSETDVSYNTYVRSVYEAPSRHLVSKWLTNMCGVLVLMLCLAERCVLCWVHFWFVFTSASEVMFLPLSVRLSVCHSVTLSVTLSVSLSVCQSVCLSVCLSVTLSVCLSVCVVCMSLFVVCRSVCVVCLSVCLSVG